MVVHRSGASSAQQSVLGRALRRALSGYRMRMEVELAASGFADRQFPQGRVLNICARPGETTISDIGRELGVSRQAASKIVARLRQIGYLDATPSDTDAREKILTVTPRAAELMAARRRAAGSIETWLRGEIGDQGVDELITYLEVLGRDAPAPSDPRSVESRAVRALRLLDDE